MPNIEQLTIININNIHGSIRTARQHLPTYLPISRFKKLNIMNKS